MPFEILPQSDYILVSIKGILNGDEKPTIDEEFKKIFDKTQIKNAVIQMSECNMLGLMALRSVAQIYRNLKSVNGNLRLTSVNEEIKKLISKNGLDRILICKISLRGALVDFGIVKAKEIDVNFINPFLTSALRVMKIQCFIEAKNKTPQLKKPEDPMLLGDVSGIIAITSETFRGTLAVSFPEKLFIKMASNMLGETHDKLHDGIVDIVGEIANIILGQAKIELQKLGFGIEMAIPSVVWGKDHKIKQFGGGKCVVIPFETSEGTFYIEIMTDQNMVQTPKKAA